MTTQLTRYKPVEFPNERYITFHALTFNARQSCGEKVAAVVNYLFFGTGLISLGAKLFGISKFFVNISLCISVLFCARKVAEMISCGDILLLNPKKRMPSLADKRTELSCLTLMKGGICYKAYTPRVSNKGPWIISNLDPALMIHSLLPQVNYMYVDHFPIDILPTRYRLGAGIEAAMQYIEQQKKAKQIKLQANISILESLESALEQHDFTNAKQRKIVYEITHFDPNNQPKVSLFTRIFRKIVNANFDLARLSGLAKKVIRFTKAPKKENGRNRIE